MSVREKRDYLYLIWKSKENRRQYIIGELSRNDSNYEFRYCDEVFEAQKEGFTPLVSFPELESVYCSKALKMVIFSQGQKWPIIHGCGDVLVVLASSQILNSKQGKTFHCFQ